MDLRETSWASKELLESDSGDFEASVWFGSAFLQKGKKKKKGFSTSMKKKIRTPCFLGGLQVTSSGTVDVEAGSADEFQVSSVSFQIINRSWLVDLTRCICACADVWNY